MAGKAAWPHLGFCRARQRQCGLGPGRLGEQREFGAGRMGLAEYRVKTLDLRSSLNRGDEDAVRQRDRGEGSGEKKQAIRREKGRSEAGLSRGGGTRQRARQGALGEGVAVRVIEEWCSVAKPN